MTTVSASAGPREYAAGLTTMNSGLIEAILPASVPVPVFVIVNERSTVSPTLAEPKSSDVGFTPHAAPALDPARAMPETTRSGQNRDPTESATLFAPALAGRKRTVNAPAAPAASA